MKSGIIVKNDRNFENYGSEEIKAISGLINLQDKPVFAKQVLQDPTIIEKHDIVMAEWGCLKFDSDVLAHLPKLEAVFYAGGSIRSIVSDTFWDRGIVISSAWGANAVSVAQYTVSQILSCLKKIQTYSQATKQARDFLSHETLFTPGTYGTTLGIISLGMIGREVCKYIQAITEMNIIAYDPCVSAEHASEMNIELCSLNEIFERSDVVSLHAPVLDETRGMITGSHFGAMKQDSTFINTARGIIVKEDEMIQVLKKRPDITAVLDVTWPEPPLPESELYDLENVTLTPHIAGCVGSEWLRMGRYMTQELGLYVAGKDLKWQITRDQAAIMA